MSREQSSDLRDALRGSPASLTAADPARPAASTAGRSREGSAIFFVNRILNHRAENNREQSVEPQSPPVAASLCASLLLPPLGST